MKFQIELISMSSEFADFVEPQWERRSRLYCGLAVLLNESYHVDSEFSKYPKINTLRTYILSPIVLTLLGYI
jgi:hypothetical protein